ncbi:MAG: sulfotransferase [Cyclobacteriaceae bacterium]|nr:sulfotransferase [Cyclobacteriaceae bacterium]
MNTILPNLIIVGAAKCGTSSLHNYLEQHPQVFMSKVKEPRFISSQFMPPLQGPGDHKVEKWYVKKFSDYKKLFENSDGYPVRGESSADTFYFYEKSIPVIKQYLGDPKIIILLRNPVKRSFSAYQHLVRDQRENLTFEEGLAHEDERIKNNWELIYHYKAVSLYAAGVKAFLENFKNVKVVLTEELEKNPQQTMADIFNFLNIETSFTISSEIRYNVSGKPRSQWLHQFLFEGHPLRNLMRPVVRLFLSHETRKRISLKVQEKNLVKMKLNSETRTMLKKYFQTDIEHVQLLLKKDLSHWLND